MALDSIKEELKYKSSLQRVKMFAENYERLTLKLKKLIQNYDHHHSSHSGYFQTSAAINELEIEINTGKLIAEAMQEFIIELQKQKNDKSN
jgi:hypothetical protein